MNADMSTPWLMLAGVVVAVVIVWFADGQVSRRRAARMRRLAQRFGFRYSRIDRFAIAKCVKSGLPVSAHSVVVRDLMYRSADADYVYVFTAVYDGELRGSLVVSARDRRGESQLTDVHCGEAELSIADQYRRLLREAAPADAEVSDVRESSPSGR